MPRYFFHRLSAGFDADEDGSELKDTREVRWHAIQFAAGTVKDHPEMVWEGGEMRVEVTDEEGRVITTVIVMAVDAQTPESMSKTVAGRS